MSTVKAIARNPEAIFMCASCKAEVEYTEFDRASGRCKECRERLDAAAPELLALVMTPRCSTIFFKELTREAEPIIAKAEGRE